MSLIWPDLSEENARRRLQVAISAIRCALNEGYLQEAGGGYIIYREPSTYSIHLFRFTRMYANLSHCGKPVSMLRKSAESPVLNRHALFTRLLFWSMIFLLIGPTCSVRSLTDSI